ncbi:hypothetical protein Bpfe_020382 [Biomphalaria pfeifferi]|uniref:Uncharacterized protein n=1 Tax=Biomphalaria pfeifferi TaxID=112525 RepID=A0AAD8F4X8_BIOPF|nr:hypothetical protein Bpfe_020382 [Biomphalaria pfeifferi]
MTDTSDGKILNTHTRKMTDTHTEMILWTPYTVWTPSHCQDNLNYIKPLTDTRKKRQSYLKIHHGLLRQYQYKEEETYLKVHHGLLRQNRYKEEETVISQNSSWPAKTVPVQGRRDISQSSSWLAKTEPIQGRRDSHISKFIMAC